MSPPVRTQYHSDTLRKHMKPVLQQWYSKTKMWRISWWTQIVPPETQQLRNTGSKTQHEVYRKPVTPQCASMSSFVHLHWLPTTIGVFSSVNRNMWRNQSGRIYYWMDNINKNLGNIAVICLEPFWGPEAGCLEGIQGWLKITKILLKNDFIIMKNSHNFWLFGKKSNTKIFLFFGAFTWNHHITRPSSQFWKYVKNSNGLEIKTVQRIFN